MPIFGGNTDSMMSPDSRRPRASKIRNTQVASSSAQKAAEIKDILASGATNQTLASIEDRHQLVPMADILSEVPIELHEKFQQLWRQLEAAYCRQVIEKGLHQDNKTYPVRIDAKTYPVTAVTEPKVDENGTVIGQQIKAGSLRLAEKCKAATLAHLNPQTHVQKLKSPPPGFVDLSSLFSESDAVSPHISANAMKAFISRLTPQVSQILKDRGEKGEGEVSLTLQFGDADLHIRYSRVQSSFSSYSNYFYLGDSETERSQNKATLATAIPSVLRWRPGMLLPLADVTFTPRSYRSESISEPIR